MEGKVVKRSGEGKNAALLAQAMGGSVGVKGEEKVGRRRSARGSC